MHVNTVKAVLTAKVFQGMKVEMFNSETFSLQIKSNVRYIYVYKYTFVHLFYKVVTNDSYHFSLQFSRLFLEIPWVLKLEIPWVLKNSNFMKAFSICEIHESIILNVFKA